MMVANMDPFAQLGGYPKEMNSYRMCNFDV